MRKSWMGSHRIHGAGIYANIWGILLMGSMLPYIAYMDPMGYNLLLAGTECWQIEALSNKN